MRVFTVNYFTSRIQHSARLWIARNCRFLYMFLRYYRPFLPIPKNYIYLFQCYMVLLIAVVNELDGLKKGSITSKKYASEAHAMQVKERARYLKQFYISFASLTAHSGHLLAKEMTDAKVISPRLFFQTCYWVARKSIQCPRFSAESFDECWNPVGLDCFPRRGVFKRPGKYPW